MSRTHRRFDVSTRRLVVTGLLACLLALAGCSSATGPTETPAETSSPTATATPSPTPSLASVSSPSGVTEDGVDPVLADVHASTLRGKTVTFEHSLSSGEFERTETHVVGADAVLITWEMGSDRTTLFANRSFAFQRHGEGSAATYSEPKVYFQRSALLRTDRLRSYLEAGAFEPTDVVQRNGTTLIELRATNLRSAAALPQYGVERASAFDARMLVSTGGQIRELTVDVTYTRAGRTVEESETYRLIETGDETVSAPSWVSEAAREAVSVEASFEDSGRYIAVENTGGSAIESGVTVSVFATESRENYDLELDQTVESGETLYLYREGDDLRSTVGEPPADGASTEFSESVYVSAHRGSTKVFGTFVPQRG